MTSRRCILSVNEGVLPAQKEMKGFYRISTVTALKISVLNSRAIRKAGAWRKVHGIHGFRDAIQAPEAELSGGGRDGRASGLHMSYRR